MGRFSEDSTFGDKSLLDFIYPIGSIYYTIDDSFDPNEYWGGTWEEINDKFIYGTSVKTEGNNNHLSKQTGGEKTHKLTINEMPSHEHKVRKRVGTTNDSYLASYKTNVSAGTLWIMPADTSWDNPDHYYAQAVGGGVAHNNMPPYYTAHIWHRTA